MVEETYWQRVRASRAEGSETLARPQDIEDLNEAYRVLMTPQLRRAYDAERTELFGPDAAPRAHQPESVEPPLRVMRKQMPALRQGPEVAEEIAADGRRFPVPARVLAGSLALLSSVSLFVARWLLF